MTDETQNVFEMKAGDKAFVNTLRLNGVDLKGVIGVSINANVGEAIEVTLTLLPGGLDIELVDPDIYETRKTV